MSVIKLKKTLQIGCYCDIAAYLVNIIQYFYNVVIKFRTQLATEDILLTVPHVTEKTRRCDLLFNFLAP